MSNETTLDFASVQAILTAESITAHGAELHGVLTGLVCAGFTFESDDYIAMINDLFNNGEGLPREVKSTVKSMFAKVWHDIIDDSYSFHLLLPDDASVTTSTAL